MSQKMLSLTKKLFFLLLQGGLPPRLSGRRMEQLWTTASSSWRPRPSRTRPHSPPRCLWVPKTTFRSTTWDVETTWGALIARLRTPISRSPLCGPSPSEWPVSNGCLVGLLKRWLIWLVGLFSRYLGWLIVHYCSCSNSL